MGVGGEGDFADCAVSRFAASEDDTLGFPKIAQLSNLPAVVGGTTLRRSLGRALSQSVDALLSIEMRESHTALERAVIDVLSDAHRGGSRGTLPNSAYGASLFSSAS